MEEGNEDSYVPPTAVEVLYSEWVEDGKVSETCSSTSVEQICVHQVSANNVNTPESIKNDIIIDENKDDVTHSLKVPIKRFPTFIIE